MLGFSSLARSIFRIQARNSLRQLSSANDAFSSAQSKLKTLKEEPDNEVKLQIYALFKQASSGDVSGSRPGMMDFVGRAKYDAWAKFKGLSQDDAKDKYAELINSLAKDEAATPASATIEGLAAVDGLDVSREGKLFKITLNRPSKFNALTLDMYRGVIAALEASNKCTATSVTVITGAGNYYCAGNDLTNFAKAASASKEETRQMAEEAGVILEQYVQAYIDHQKPLIAIINGPAVGISVTVLPLFDYILTTDKATLHTPFATLGQSPEGASSYTFPLLMGQMRAADVLLFGKKLTAHDALEYGLVSQVVQDGELAKISDKVLSNISNLPPESLRVNKTLLRSVHRDGLTKANKEECRTIIGRWQSKECAQAIAAFLSRSMKKK